MTDNNNNNNDDDEEEKNVGKICRICHESDKVNVLISPCNCTGSTKWVHRTCLDQWRQTSDLHFTVCEICRFQYVLEEQHYSSREWNWQYFMFAVMMTRDILYAVICVNVVIVLVAMIFFWADSFKLSIYNSLGIDSIIGCYYVASCLFLSMMLGFVIILRTVFDSPGTGTTILICDESSHQHQGGACLYVMVIMVVVGIIASIVIAVYYIFWVLFNQHRHLLWRGLETRRYQVKNFGDNGVSLA